MQWCRPDRAVDLQKSRLVQYGEAATGIESASQARKCSMKKVDAQRMELFKENFDKLFGEIPVRKLDSCCGREGASDAEPQRCREPVQVRLLMALWHAFALEAI